MNALGFVLSLLTILAFGAMLSLERQTSFQRLKHTYLGHIQANRSICNQIISTCYDDLKSKPSEKNAALESISPPAHPAPAIPLPPPINPDCARINLFPLVSSPQQHPLLHAATLRLLQTFYGTALLDPASISASSFLAQLLQAIRIHQETMDPFHLEKIQLSTSKLQSLYYRMLKGTKGSGYPSLLDYLKCTQKPSAICLIHAHPKLLSILFSSKAAEAIYDQLHVSKPPQLTKELIERICQETHTAAPHPDFMHLLNLHLHPKKREHTCSLIGEDDEGKIFLKRIVASAANTEN